MALRVLHLTGSSTTQELDDLSRLYGGDCLEAVDDPSRYEPVIAHVSPGGTWRFPLGLSDAALADAAPMRAGAAMVLISQMGIDVMVPHMFCPDGMTRYRALFDTLDIPYIGNPPEAMAITARKDLTRAIVDAAGVRVPAGFVVRDGGSGDLGEAARLVVRDGGTGDLGEAARLVVRDGGTGGLDDLAFPVVVKPVDADNSVGVNLVRAAGGYAAAVAEACEHGSAALVEQFIEPGREVRCGILERDGKLVCLPLEEYPVDGSGRPVRRAGDKLRRNDGGELELVAKGGSHAWTVDSDDPVCAAVWEAARRCHRALACRHYSLFDFRIDPAGQPWFLEAGLYCSFAPKSVVATMAAAAGIPVTELFALMVAAALGPRLSSAGVAAERGS